MSNSESTIYDVAIIGGGYSGLIAAISCARKSKKVCVLEKNDLLGKKILATGNGRCNFTNSNMDLNNFYSSEKIDFNFTGQDIESINFFKEIGIIEKNLNGYYYPITNQAKTIREALDNEARRLGINIFLNETVEDIDSNGDFIIKTANSTFCSHYLLISTGGKAAPATGSDGFGFKLADKFNIKYSNLKPALVGFKSTDSSLKTLAGVRALGQVAYKNQLCQGEIQFNKDSISGYPVMCISRFYDSSDKKIIIDFCPYFSDIDLANNIKNRVFGTNHFKIISKALNGLANDKCIQAVLKKCDIALDKNTSLITEGEIGALVNGFKFFALTISDTKGFENAQTTAGGILLSELTSTLESKKIKNLYFIGEVVDIDGICGGYNLQWAFTSARLAAKDIIEKG